MQYFFYGTLMDADVRGLVLSPASRETHVEPATLQGYRRVFMAERVYPVIAPSPASSVAGVLSLDLNEEDAARLAAFESDEYDEATLDVIAEDGQSVAARVFVAGSKAVLSDVAWDLADWQRRHKRMFLQRTQRRI
jgi:gamma-glutamylcyclotransferase (GGCT)/AIG2-like uncharacterized protein YtfP